MKMKNEKKNKMKEKSQLFWNHLKNNFKLGIFYRFLL